MVDSLTVEFDGLVDIQAGGLEVWRRARGTTPAQQVEVEISTQESNGGTLAILTFRGSLTTTPSIPGSSLLDGNYELRINGELITNRFGTRLDADKDGQAGGSSVFGDAEVDVFYRYFGDSNGDRVVGIAEFGQFRATFGKLEDDDAFNELFDYEENGAVGISDFGQFRARFGKRLHFE
ncbi:MAG: hypothetical protein NXI32_29830, partial [bacterium]|nr:hypothetical protein [bacterium]